MRGAVGRSGQSGGARLVGGGWSFGRGALLGRTGRPVAPRSTARRSGRRAERAGGAERLTGGVAVLVLPGHGGAVQGALERARRRRLDVDRAAPPVLNLAARPATVTSRNDESDVFWSPVPKKSLSERYQPLADSRQTTLVPSTASQPDDTVSAGAISSSVTSGGLAAGQLQRRAAGLEGDDLLAAACRDARHARRAAGDAASGAREATRRPVGRSWSGCRRTQRAGASRAGLPGRAAVRGAAGASRRHRCIGRCVPPHRPENGPRRRHAERRPARPIRRRW